MTNPININFDDFRIRLLGYRTAFSCLYLPHGHGFKSTLWLWSTDAFRFVLFHQLTDWFIGIMTKLLLEYSVPQSSI